MACSSTQVGVEVVKVQGTNLLKGAILLVATRQLGLPP
jgi:hypothetical protein